MWADLLNKEAKIRAEDTLLLVQGALVLLGNVYEKRDINLFGPGFLEKASKKLEADKAISKVADDSRGGPALKKHRFSNSSDKTDLQHFLDKGPSERYGGKRDRRQQPYTVYTRFNQGKYFQQRNPMTPKAVNHENSNQKQEDWATS